jgi:hypothetical protein
MKEHTTALHVPLLVVSIWGCIIVAISYVVFTAIPFFVFGIHLYAYEEILAQIPQTIYDITIFSLFGLWTVFLLPFIGGFFALVTVLSGIVTWRRTTVSVKRYAIVSLMLFICTMLLWLSPLGTAMNTWMVD